MVAVAPGHTFNIIEAKEHPMTESTAPLNVRPLRRRLKQGKEALGWNALLGGRPPNRYPEVSWLHRRRRLGFDSK